MIDHLVHKKVNMQMEYLPDHKFIKKLSDVCADLFNYRIKISPENFIESGFSERKMVLVLELYDVVKLVRKQSKIQNKLEYRDP